MRLPFWYLVQLAIWLLTGVPLYAITALWGSSDWWLMPNIYQSDLSLWEIVFFTIIFFHPLLTAPFAITAALRRSKFQTNPNGAAE